MKVLIAGAAGQLGRALQRTAPAGTTIVALTRQQLDIGEERLVSECVRQHKPDLIINAAAYTAVERAESEPAAAQRINVDGPRYIAENARQLGVRLLHVSTDFVFDGTASLPYSPDASTNPLSVYGRTKRDGEHEVLRILPQQSLILRTAWVYAAQGANFLSTMLRLMNAGKPVRVVVDQIGTPTAAASLAAVLWRLADRPELYGIQHWTDAGVASWYDFAVAIAEEAAPLKLVPGEIIVEPIPASEFPTRAVRPRYSVLDKTALQTALALAPVHWRVRLREVLREVSHA